jgi:hypothetical protein
MEKTKSNAGIGRRPSQILYSTTDGRQRFPDILQVSYGEKAVIGFDRYGRPLGAVVPMEAVRMLAGKTDVDQGVMAIIKRAAENLLSEVDDPGEDVGLETLDADRALSNRDLETPTPRKRGAGI